MIDSGVWRIACASLKHQMFKNNKMNYVEVIWAEILISANKSEIILLYNDVIENEVLNDKKTFFIENGNILDNETETSNKIEIIKTKSENAIKDMKKYGRRINTTSQLSDDLENIIRNVTGDMSDKQILRDAISNDCDWIITFNKKHFKTGNLNGIIEIANLFDYKDSFEASELLRKLRE